MCWFVKRFVSGCGLNEWIRGFNCVEVEVVVGMMCGLNILKLTNDRTND